MPTHTQVELQCGKCWREQLLKCFKILVAISIILKFKKGQAGLESCPADFDHSVQTLLRCLDQNAGQISFGGLWALVCVFNREIIHKSLHHVPGPGCR